jgi:hypothetical protein
MQPKLENPKIDWNLGPRIQNDALRVAVRWRSQPVYVYLNNSGFVIHKLPSPSGVKTGYSRNPPSCGVYRKNAREESGRETLLELQRGAVTLAAWKETEYAFLIALAQTPWGPYQWVTMVVERSQGPAADPFYQYQLITRHNLMSKSVKPKPASAITPS